MDVSTSLANCFRQVQTTASTHKYYVPPYKSMVIIGNSNFTHARAIARRELEEKQAAAYRSVEEKESKLTVAREILADSFPLRDTPPMGFAVGEAAGGLGEQSTTSKEVEEVGAKTPAGKKRKTKAASTKKSSPATASSATKPESAGKKTATTAVPVMEKDGGDDGVEATREDAVVEKKPRKPAARKNAAKDQAEEEADNTATPPLSPAVTAAVSAGVAAAASTSAQNGSLQPAMDASTTVPVGTKQATGEQTADEYDDLSEDLSRALRGVQGFDLDALDLEMDDLRPEDLEVIRIDGSYGMHQMACWVRVEPFDWGSQRLFAFFDPAVALLNTVGNF